MRNFLFFLVVFILSLLQAVVLPFNFLLIFVLLKNDYFWAFFTGVVLDLMASQRLGFSSLLFLAILFLFRLYSRKYEPRNFFLAVFVFLTSFLFAKAEAIGWSFREGIVLILCSLLLKNKFQEKRQLKLDL